MGLDAFQVGRDRHIYPFGCVVEETPVFPKMWYAHGSRGPAHADAGVAADLPCPGLHLQGWLGVISLLQTHHPALPYPPRLRNHLGGLPSLRIAL